MKLSRTEEVVAKQLYSLRQQNKVEGLFIDAASVLDTIFQAKKWNSSIPLFPRKPSLFLGFGRRTGLQKRQPSHAMQLRRGTSAPASTCDPEMGGYSQGGIGMESPHLPSRDTDPIWICEVGNKKA